MAGLPAIFTLYRNEFLRISLFYNDERLRATVAVSLYADII